MKKNKNALQFKKAWDLISKSQSFFLTTHEGTDGDDLGSLLAVKRVLESKGKKVTAAVVGGIPPTLRFLPESNTLKEGYIDGEYDLVLTFGCAHLSRPGMPQLHTLKVSTINFDHHQDNSFFATVNVVDTDTAAVAELVYYFLQHNDEQIDHLIATYLLSGIFWDTGGYKHDNTSADVLEVSADLLKKGARIDKIATFIYGQKSPKTIKAWSRAIENLRFNPEKKLVYSVLTEDDFKEIGADQEDLQGKVLIELLNHVPEAKYVLLLKESKGFVKGSLRSEPYKNMDVSEIARAFGGGGHKLAAGFRIKGKLVKSGKSWEIK
ncbi:MAG TPA: bifunctional oligoribonuclease/PAP phosphatase NrnA [Verrucomicrobiae bacterium]|nr:bifunctional oligoribonuclease/PAP phosphatase NrnA [Verrucomicrobiae bacterium]